MEIPHIEPSRGLYNKVRGGFIAQGISLSKWCEMNDLNTQNAHSCLIGTWNGPKAKKLRHRLVDASGISKPFLTHKPENESSQQNVA